MRLFIVCAIWGNTKNNHAGMYYLGKRIREDAPASIDVELIPIYVRGSFYLRPVYYLINLLVSIYLYCRVSKNDIVFLMEYLLPVCEQGNIAKRLKGKAKIVSIAHLVPSRIEKAYSDARLKEMISFVNYLFVLGSSLKTYFINRNINEKYIVKTFHYVDTDFYYPIERKNVEVLNVICMGNMERNYAELEKIVLALPQIHFHICMGVSKDASFLKKNSNVSIYSYIEETKLRDLMQRCNISLNIMNDTIGSNVITTSLASGLGIIASNVGSISDYVTDGREGYLINSVDDAIICMQKLYRNKNLLREIQINAVKKAETLSVENFEKMFFNFIERI